MAVTHQLLAAVNSGRVYATWDPSAAGATVTLSNGNLTESSTSYASVRSNISKTSGKWYWETTMQTNYVSVGVSNGSNSLTTYLGNATGGTGYVSDTGSIRSDGSNIKSVGYAYSGDVIGVAFNKDADTMTIYINGVLKDTVAIPSDRTFAGIGFSSDLSTTNFGATSFAYPVPSGFNSGLYSGS